MQTNIENKLWSITNNDWHRWQDTYIWRRSSFHCNSFSQTQFLTPCHQVQLYRCQVLMTVHQLVHCTPSARYINIFNQQSAKQSFMLITSNRVNEKFSNADTAAKNIHRLKVSTAEKGTEPRKLSIHSANILLIQLMLLHQFHHFLCFCLCLTQYYNSRCQAIEPVQTYNTTTFTITDNHLYASISAKFYWIKFFTSKFSF